MTDLTPVFTATVDYDDWLRSQVDVLEADLHLKHRQMASSLFIFLRATFYRWGPLWRDTCPDLVETPRVLAVGDLHVENFGTWRDKEGRLVWGVNDFDEVARMPYAVDLVRLARSSPKAKIDSPLMPLALQLRCLTVIPNSSKLAASHLFSKKATPIFAKRRSGQSVIQFTSGRSSLLCTAPHPPSVFSGCCVSPFPTQSRILRSCTVSPGKEAWADRATSQPAPVMVVSSLARRKRGCRQHGAGPRDGRSSMHIQ